KSTFGTAKSTFGTAKSTFGTAKSTFGTAKSTFGTAKLIFESSTFSSTKLNPQIFKSSLLTLSSTGGGACKDISAVGRKQQFPQSNSANSAVGKKLSIDNLQLSEANCPLSIVNCKLSIVHYPLLILLCLFFSVNAFAQYGGGNGTEGNPYIISTAAHLSELATNVNGGNAYSGKYFKLTANISSGNTMIGSYSSYPFSGTFDGDGHTITVNISGSTTYVALFVYVNNATIKNLTVGGSVTNTSPSTAAIVSMANNSTILNCTNNADVNGGVNFSGVVCSCNSSTVVKKCVNNGTIGSSCNNWRRGGVVCNCTGSSIIECTNNGAVNGTEGLGGITYSAGSNSIIDKCVNNGTITGNDVPDNNFHNGFGGIVGSCSSTTIRNSYNAGYVHFNANGVNGSYYFLGGIAGMCEDANVYIENCYNIGDVRTNNNLGYYIGGIVGKSENAKLRNCYNGGKVSNTDGNYQNVGAITGYATINGAIVNCYAWDGSAVNSNYSDAYKLRLYGSYVSGCTLSDNVWFTHNSNTDNKLKSNVSVNGTSYTASNTNSLLTVLNAWVTANGNDYLTWVNATSESDNKGMPKFYSCTPVPDPSLSVTQTNTGGRELRVSWTATPGVSYTLYYGVNDPNSGLENVYNAGTQTSPYNALRLTNGVEYHFAIKPTGTGDYCTDNPLSSTVSATPECNE
ncbi:MAG: hypothetical protein IKJ56_10945, partial [Bacteroidales bacterium]|nr:hypothetical protein [Bacteroidales bacterium]